MINIFIYSFLEAMDAVFKGKHVVGRDFANGLCCGLYRNAEEGTESVDLIYYGTHVGPPVITKSLLEQKYMILDEM